MSDTVEMDGQNHQIKNVRIWEHGAESVGFNYQTVTSHYKAAIFSGNTVNRLTTQNRSNTQLHTYFYVEQSLSDSISGPVRDILRQLHLVSVKK